MNDDAHATGNRKAVYTIVERGEGKPAKWLRIGIAFVNRDGSYNVLLDALPTNGQLHIRDFPPAESAEANLGAIPSAEEKPARKSGRAARA